MLKLIYPLDHSPIRDILDPRHTLMPILFSPDTEARQFKDVHPYFIEDAAGKVGRVSIDSADGRMRCFGKVEVDADLRGYGFGMAAYVLAIEDAHVHGDVFRTNPEWFREPAAKMWQRLIAAGVGEVIEPIVPYIDRGIYGTDEWVHDIDGTPLYEGYIRIPPLQRS